MRFLLVVVTALTLVASVVAGDNAADDGKLRIIVFGAHPDDAEYRAGGCGAMWSKLGHHVKLVSVTNGDIGHWAMSGGALAKRRAEEVRKASEILGTTSEVMDIHDGELMPTLENRRAITRLIREWNADVVIAHRPWDYHPDHRYVGVLVQDASFMVTVPFFCPDTPPLKKNPVFLYASDRFKKPYPFTPDIAVSIDAVFETKVNAIAELESQVFDGGALGNAEIAAEAPPARMRDLRLAEVTKTWQARSGNEADSYRNALVRWYGEEDGNAVKYAEVFEICEYGHQPTEEDIKRLFPFFSQAHSK
ncbi:PIG-L deacetylase family protein [Allorhodopirellula heiligendammensis]|uniref:Mycothiol S-conjugate amidase n=1 Tax=Allorhodopirellula heiligendammensis TaxID=2714739 RepID=A0A5C6C2S3_9BACT|nr:PIG-L family deacetylase [Allorhodopirellula heiligendammensis]TWU18307.1 Mycothiol S-conjugate amidase [Allorhodopirellula heiligendammensis]